MVSSRGGVAAAAARSAAWSRWCSSVAALYYGVHIGEVYLRYYRLLDAMRFQASMAPTIGTTTSSTAGSTATADSILGQAPRFRIDRSGNRTDHHRDRIQRACRSAVLQAHLRAPPARRSAALGPRCARSVAPPPFRASPGGRAEGVDVARFFLVLAAMLVAAKLLGELAERIGQPAVLGELVAGVLLGGSVLGVVPADGAEAELIHVLAELGVLLLLFEIGLETDLREMFRVGPASLAVAAVGVALPFALRLPLLGATLPHPAVGQRRPGDRRHLHRRDPHRHFGRHHRPGAVRSGPDAHAGGPHHHRRRGHR